jgi:hypothetical protein
LLQAHCLAAHGAAVESPLLYEPGNQSTRRENHENLAQRMACMSERIEAAADQTGDEDSQNVGAREKA